jgi:hypothetical protein
LCRFVPRFFSAVFCRSYLNTQTFFSVEFWKEDLVVLYILVEVDWHLV